MNRKPALTKRDWAIINAAMALASAEDGTDDYAALENEVGDIKASRMLAQSDEAFTATWKKVQARLTQEDVDKLDSDFGGLL